MFAAKRLPSVIATLPVALAMVMFLIFPARYAESVRTGISLWAINVLPATFPFLFLTALFTKMKPYGYLARKISPAAEKLFRVSGAGGCAAVMSALSGYPVGAKTLCDLRERGAVSQSETFRLSCLCSTSGPMFLVGTVGCIMYESARAGWILLVSHLAAVYMICFILRFFGKKESSAPPPFRPEGLNALYDSLYQAVVSILCVGGFIALFYAFGQILSDLGIFAPAGTLFGHSPLAAYAEGFLRGLLEMTSGCALLSGGKTPLSLALSCFLVTFGGMCVLCQQAAYLSRAGVKILPFVGIKFLQALLAALLCFALACLFGV